MSDTDSINPDIEESWGEQPVDSSNIAMGDLPPSAKDDAARAIWTAEDAAQLRALADEHPTEIGESLVLDTILDHEGIR